jgi:hypothetical protein
VAFATSTIEGRMTTDTGNDSAGAVAYASPDVPAVRSSDQRRRAVWPAVMLVALYWAVVGVTTFLDVGTFSRFMTQFLVLIGVTLAFVVWWLCTRRVSWGERLLVLGAAVAAPVVGVLASDPTLGPITVFNGLPIMFTAWAAWLLLARNASRTTRRNGLVAVIFLSFAAFPLFRMEGLKGEGQADLHWRWSRRPGERYAAAPTGNGTAATTSQPTTRSAPLTLRPGDWPGFRGPNRDSVVRGITISTDWEKSPPKQLWRRPVGAAWSSVAVVDGRAFTQEQRGQSEAVVCRDAETGSELWSHEEPGRFIEALSSLGPRATPTFDNGRIYAQGAAGILVCLDAASGAKFWSRDVLKDADAKMPDWGVSSSPLVSKGVVIVFAAGHGKKGLLGYRADSGEPAWSQDVGVSSYSSPHPATIGGREQVLFIGDQGLHAIDPASGSVLWEYRAPGQPPRSLQPAPVGNDQLLVPMGLEVATDLLDVKAGAPGDAAAATKRWSSRNLKPSFNDFVVHDGHAYGFDGAIFTCVELKTGGRKWKQGRYGTGQVVLLADQALLLVLSDKGEVVLLSARPDQFEERGQFQAITGKTWNHPAVAQGRLYVRNAEEMACYDLRRQ